MVRFNGASWTVYTTEDGLIHNMIYDIVQTPDGAIWFATRRGLSRFDGQKWTSFTPAEGGARSQKITSLGVDHRGVLWIGHGEQGEGVTSYDGESWTRHTSGFRLVSDAVWKIYAARNGVLWFGTNSGLARFDGSAWSGFPPDELPLPPVAAIQGITESIDGSLWLRNFGPGVLRMKPDRTPPDTALEPVGKEVSSAGNLQLKWTGGDLWNETELEDLRYQWRLNGEVWASVSDRTEITLTGLASGEHTFEVRSVDKYSNVDPSPAAHAFIVEAPWWRNPVVAGPGLLLIIAVLFQSARVVQGKRKLQDSVDALSSANNELFQVNRDLESVNVDLQREQVLERLRGLSQGMQSSEDIKPVVEAVYRELNQLGLPLVSAGVTINLSETDLEWWMIDEDSRALEPHAAKRLGVMGPARAAILRGEDYHHHRKEDEELKELLRRFVGRGHPRWKGIPEDRWPQKLDFYSVFFEGGSFTVESEELVPEEYLLLIKRFGEVFGFAHSRYKELQQKEAQNRRLSVEASVQRLRAEVQSMDEASDFERILSLLTESLKTVELTFDGCEIDVLDEPVEDPSMELFEAKGFRYTTFRLDPNGNVTSNSHNLAAPFPSVIEQTVERFIAGEPWQGTSEGQAIVEVPAGAYGRLRLTATDRQNFDEDEVATLREFADAVALGYARYLDIREIQLNTERKSEFLASMSHELRTPMNAIKGFTNLVLGRDPGLADRSRENLQKVDQASDHLLGMINDLLDLSKIEAGRMDVNPERLDVGELIRSACDTVSPLIQEGVELRQDVADEIGEANTDKARLHQMVINLLSNAIKFTDTGSVTVSASTEGGQLVIAVSDTGKGIPADELPTIFDEYRQAEGSESAVQKGTGLGLSITKKFAELLGGTIGVESETGRGSTFTVRVPVEYSQTA